MAKPSLWAQAFSVYIMPSGRQCELITWFARVAGATAIDGTYATDLAGAISAAYAVPIKNVLVAAAGYAGSKVRINDGGVIWPGASIAGRGPGANTGDQLPDHVAVVIRKFGGGPGRSGYGRWYISGIPEAYNSDNTLDPTLVASYITLGTALETDVIEATSGDRWEPQHYSRKLDNFYTIEDTLVEEYVRRQDRRLFRSLI